MAEPRRFEREMCESSRSRRSALRAVARSIARATSAGMSLPVRSTRATVRLSSNAARSCRPPRSPNEFHLRVSFFHKSNIYHKDLNDSQLKL